MPSPAPPPLHFDLTDLRLFVNIAESNSMTRGAARSSLSVPAASMRVKHLEDALATQLLYRTRRGVTLTPAGQTLLHHARQIVRQLESLRGDLQDYSAGIRGHIRLFANTTAMTEFLPTALSGFLTGHPSISVDLQERLSHEIVRNVAEGVADIGIVAGNVRTDGLQALPYRSDKLVLATARRHALAGARRVDFLDVLEHEFVSLHSGSAIHAFLTQAAADAGRELRVRIQVGSFDAMCQMIGQNVGIGVLPQSAALRHQQSAGLHLAALANPWAIRDLKLIVREMAALPAFAQRLVAFLQQSVGN